MPADFLANDFSAIARAMRREAEATTRVVLHLWGLDDLVTTEHESVEVAVTEAFAVLLSHTAIPERITTIDGTVLMGGKALAEAVALHREGMPV